MLSALVVLVCALTGDSPLDFGRSELARGFHAAGIDARVAEVDLRVSPGGRSESFAIRRDGGHVVIDGADEGGAMYGALELGERVRLYGATALENVNVKASPFLLDRGLNVFLTLPWNYEKNDTDYDPAALTDRDRWWFQNDGYWTTLLDLMARARLNWLDLHGTWDISVTDAPNLYAYFVNCPDFPGVGVSSDIKAANLARLNRVTEMAHARGIRVSLMAYEARLATPHNRNPPYPNDEKTAYDYTRQAVEMMIRGVPGLDAIGFRVGESGHGGEFFRCYPEAVERSGRAIPLYTRSWVTRRAKLLPLAAASSDFTVEIKYNGEQWGPAYPIAGGRAAGWYSYSFEDYLSDPGAGPFRQLWPGNAVANGETWPSEPYKIVWQVRLNGTHRIFPFYDPEWVRRSVRAMKLGTASGYTVEPINAYFPASQNYYLADPHDRWCNWIHERDALFLTSWGRLGYDPDTPPEVFAAMMRERFGSHADAIAKAWQAASRVVPTAFSAYSLGPDHRSHAPELEWGGDSHAFIDREPFDSHVFMSVKEFVSEQATGGIDGRLTPLDAASMLDSLKDESLRLSGIPLSEVPEPARGQVHELEQAAAMLAHLGGYYAARMRGAVALAQAEAAPADRDGALRETGSRLHEALDAWRLLSDSPEARFYRPFTDRLRMHTNEFHWRAELPKMEQEAKRYPAEPVALPALSSPHRPAIEPQVSARFEGENVVCSVPADGVSRAWLLHKPLPSSTFFHKIVMTRAADGASFRASVPRIAAGTLVAAEIERDGVESRIPSWDPGPPYIIIPSQSGPTPTYYSSEEALTYLKPEVLTPDRYSMLLVCTRAWDMHRDFPLSVQRKLIDAVERGLPLLVLQQDYTSGRYPLAWLGPNLPVVVNDPSRTFDSTGALSLPKIETDDILWQRFKPSPGWDILGNGGIAHSIRGKGEIWMFQARLMQRMHIPECARALQTLLSMKGTDKPVVLVDAGTEGADFATSVFADFMNAHDIPFLTLGEVIAAEQGADCLTPIPGPISDDTVLEGRGGQIMRSFLLAKVKAAARLPAPTSVQELDARRAAQKARLMKSLGLDPLPDRTPLNARITGTLQRQGYRIERLVFESRPNFPVTALVYVPDGPAGTRSPIIVNPHGHWQHKKAEPVVQTRAIAQALHGYLAVLVDSPGFSFEGNTPVERRWAGTHDDLALTLGAGCTTGIYVWDLMRTIDYLETRPDADTARIGITGASGGGLATVYAFAADDRFTAAVPVCYATSLEVNPNNGCLCNHVPGTLQIGDRADVLAIRAPSPVLVIGASNDQEFPPEGTRLTGEKLRSLYSLYSAADHTRWQVFDSSHDYNRPMREAAIGFFDLHLRGVGDGSPVAEPEIVPEPADSKDLVCFPDPPARLKTMRDIARERLSLAAPRSFAEVASLNGGIPVARALNARVLGQSVPLSHKLFIVFDSEPGLSIPGVLLTPAGEVHGAVVLISEQGKAAAPREFNTDALLAAGIASLCIDVRGFGELQGLDERLMAYLGAAAPFAMGWDGARAARALRELAPQLSLPPSIRIGVAGKGASGAQAAMFASLLDPGAISFVVGLDGIRDYSHCFDSTIPHHAIQFRAADGAPLPHLRSLVNQPARWQYQGEVPLDASAAITSVLYP
jgi:dienelactone hydrolase